MSVRRAERIDTRRLELHPLHSADADEMFAVLNDERLHQFTGGRPLTLAELRERYRVLAGGRSPDGNEAWINWTVRLRTAGAAIGSIQAGVTGSAAEVAWVVGRPWQGRGYASEAAQALIVWLRARNVERITARIHPGHAASEAVARRAGLSSTGEVVDGEVVWSNPAST